MDDFKLFIIEKIKKESKSFLNLALIFSLLSICIPSFTLIGGGITSGTFVRQGSIGFLFSFLIGPILTFALWRRWIIATINPKKAGVYKLLFTETNKLKSVEIKWMNHKACFYREDGLVQELPLGNKSEVERFLMYVKTYLPNVGIK